MWVWYYREARNVCFIYNPECGLVQAFSLLCFFLNINFWGLHYVFVAAHELSLVAVTGGYSSFQCLVSLFVEHRFQGTLASVVAAHGLSHCGSPAREHKLSH